VKRWIALGLVWLASTGALVTLPACKSDGQKAAPASAPAKTAAHVTIETADRKIVFRVEVALTPEEHARGLMYRTRLATDAGMIFVFDEPQIQRFWMKNTLIPLDIVFIRADGTISSIAADAKPLSLKSLRSTEPVQAVLEINGGRAEALHIREGGKVHSAIFEGGS
jgi:hypothetical protein